MEKSSPRIIKVNDLLLIDWRDNFFSGPWENPSEEISNQREMVARLERVRKF